MRLVNLAAPPGGPQLVATDTHTRAATMMHGRVHVRGPGTGPHTLQVQTEAGREGELLSTSNQICSDMESL